MKKIQNFQDQQLTNLAANDLKGGGKYTSLAMGFCEWYISLGDKGAQSGFLTYLNGAAENYVQSNS